MKTKDEDIIKKVLMLEHQSIAKQIGFIDSVTVSLDYDLLINALGLLDKLSRQSDEQSKKTLITLSAIIWTYRKQEWAGLRDFLMPILTRAGFAPSSIMIDENYDKENHLFTHMSSCLAEIDVVINQSKFEIKVKDKHFLLTSFQKQIWDAFNDYKLVGISAPTSAGKSFIIILKAMDLLLKKAGNVVYIVPTLSLVSQVCTDFRKQLNLFGLNDYIISTTYNAEIENDKNIYVLTQERAISAFNQNDKPFENLNLLVVDEIQNLERVGDEEEMRSKVLYDTLMEFRHACTPNLTIIAGPRIKNIGNIGIQVLGENDLKETETKSSPVSSITYSIAKTNNKYVFKQYNEIHDSSISLEINNSQIIKGYGQSTYNKHYYSYFSNILSSIGKDSTNIVFAPTSDKAQEIAENIIADEKTDESLINLLSDYIAQTVHQSYTLRALVKKQVAFHHGRLPSHIRLVVERAIRDGLIKNIVCTTTLMQGVNLPAQNLFMRNPDLAIKRRKGKKPKLTTYEIANLRGRAGRLMNDFIGRAFIIEENSFFEENDSINLFGEDVKEIHTGYGTTYQQNKEEIDSKLLSGESNLDMNESSFITTHIRQTILKYGEDSINRLKAVGIELEKEKIDSIKNTMLQFSVPKDICYKNRYWDPFVLNNIFVNISKYKIPTNHLDAKFAYKLSASLKELYQDHPKYFERYKIEARSQNTQNPFYSLSITAVKWMKENTLHDILNTTYHNDMSKINSTIRTIQNTISFGLPMLLKPLYDITNPGCMVLRFIEMGAYNPVPRKMIELNIPRETALFLSKKYFSNEINSQITEGQIVDKLKSIAPNLDYWIKIQLEHLI